MLTKKLTKVGNSHAMYLGKDVLSMVDAEPDTVFKITVEGRKIVLEPVSKQELHEHTLKVAREIMKTHDSVFKKLAE